jgi:hypothetical protein
LTGLVEAIRVWAETHIEAVLDAQQTFDLQAADAGDPKR